MLTWRRLRVLLAQLPPTSALMRELAPAGAWATAEARVLAAIYQVLTGKQYPELAEAIRSARAAEVTERLERWRQRHPDAVTGR